MIYLKSSLTGLVFALLIAFGLPSILTLLYRLAFDQKYEGNGGFSDLLHFPRRNSSLPYWIFLLVWFAFGFFSSYIGLSQK